MFKKYKKFREKLARAFLKRHYFSNKRTFNYLKNILFGTDNPDKKLTYILLSDVKNQPELAKILSHSLINDYYKTNKLEEDYDTFLGGLENYIEKNKGYENKALNISLFGIAGIVSLVFLSLLGSGILTTIFASILLSSSILFFIGFLAGFLAYIHEFIETSILFNKKEKASKKLLKDLEIDEPNDTYYFLLNLMAINKFDKTKMKEIEELLAQFSGFDSISQNNKTSTIKKSKEDIDAMKEKMDSIKEKLLIELHK